MAKKFAEFLGMDQDGKVAEAERDEFLYHLQKALLLALKERGRLNAMQYRYAEERLKQQRRDQARKLLRVRGDGECGM